MPLKYLTIEEAERRAKRRLDRRRKYFLWNHKVHYEVHYTNTCWGCCELGDYGSFSEFYGWDEKARCLIGSGCEECGYTGKRRSSYPVPFDYNDWDKPTRSKNDTNL